MYIFVQQIFFVPLANMKYLQEETLDVQTTRNLKVIHTYNKEAVQNTIKNHFLSLYCGIGKKSFLEIWSQGKMFLFFEKKILSFKH